MRCTFLLMGGALERRRDPGSREAAECRAGKGSSGEERRQRDSRGLWGPRLPCPRSPGKQPRPEAGSRFLANMTVHSSFPESTRETPRPCSGRTVAPERYVPASIPWNHLGKVFARGTYIRRQVSFTRGREEAGTQRRGRRPDPSLGARGSRACSHLDFEDFDLVASRAERE